MKIIPVILLLLLSFLGTHAQSSPEGTWNTGKENTMVEIKEQDGLYVGHVIASNKAKIGKQLLKDLKAEGEAWKGKIFAPRRGQWFDASLKVNGEQLIIVVGSGFRSRTVKWKRE